MSDQNPFHKRLRQVGAIWTRYKVIGIRVLLLLLLVFLLLAEVFPSLQDFVTTQPSRVLAIAVAMMFVLFDAIVSPPSALRTDQSLVLPHFTDLRPHLRQAFDKDVVELDIAAYSSETFYGLLTEFLQEVADGRNRLRRLHLRIIVPDCSAPMAVPCLLDTGEEDTGYKRSIQVRNQRFATEFAHYFTDIRRAFPHMDTHLEIRMHRFSPLFKMIKINDRSLFIGFYPIAETPVNVSGQPIILWDYRGERCRLLGLSLTDGLSERELGHQLVEWFESVWKYLSVPIRIQ